MRELKKFYTELYTLPVPKGFEASTEDLQIRVYQYADDLMGIASSYLAGKKMESINADIGKNLDGRLQESLAKLHELMVYKQKFDVLAHLIQDMSEDAAS